MTDADTIPPPTPDDLGRDLAADYRRAVTKADYMLPATIRRAAAESIIAATEKVIADRGICERDCTAPLPDRVDSLIVEDRNAQHWRGMYEAENARLAVAEAERDAAVQRAERAEAELAKLKGPTP